MQDRKFDQLFEEYWQWLFDDFQNGKPHDFFPERHGPHVGNRRCIEHIDENKIILREASETSSKRRARFQYSRAEIKADLAKLYADPESEDLGIKKLRERHCIKMLAEFKYPMFRELLEFGMK